jgi:hypothetical protein
VESLQILNSIGAEAGPQGVVKVLGAIRDVMGAENFDIAWKEVTDSPLPEWFVQSQQPEQGMTAEQFIARAIQSAREKRPEAEEYFKDAQRLASDSNAPKEVQELGRVIQRVMIGDKNADLSSLPREWAEAITKALE